MKRDRINLQNNGQRGTTMRRAGRPKGITHEMMEGRRHLERKEQNESKAEQSLRRSERIKRVKIQR